MTTTTYLASLITTTASTITTAAASTITTLASSSRLTQASRTATRSTTDKPKFRTMEIYNLTDDEDLLLSNTDQHMTEQTVQPDTDQHMTEHTIYDTLRTDLALPPLNTATTTNSTTTTYTNTQHFMTIINIPQSNQGPSTIHDNTSSNPRHHKPTATSTSTQKLQPNPPSIQKQHKIKFTHSLVSLTILP